MRKAKILALAIATILSAYMLTLTMSSQAFAQAQNQGASSPSSALVEGS